MNPLSPFLYCLLYLPEFPHSILKFCPYTFYIPLSSLPFTFLFFLCYTENKPTFPQVFHLYEIQTCRFPPPFLSPPFIYLPISMLHSESAKLTVMLWWGRSPILRTLSLAISRAGRTRSMENNRLLSLGIMVAIFITWGVSAMSPRTKASTQITERSFNSPDIFLF